MAVTYNGQLIKNFIYNNTVVGQTTELYTQNEIDSIATAVTTKGVTPETNTPIDIISAIQYLGMTQCCWYKFKFSLGQFSSTTNSTLNSGSASVQSKYYSLSGTGAITNGSYNTGSISATPTHQTKNSDIYGYLDSNNPVFNFEIEYYTWRSSSGTYYFAMFPYLKFLQKSTIILIWSDKGTNGTTSFDYFGTIEPNYYIGNENGLPSSHTFNAATTTRTPMEGSEGGRDPGVFQLFVFDH